MPAATQPLVVDSSSDSNHAYTLRSDTKVQLSDGFTFGMAFASRQGYLSSSTVCFSYLLAIADSLCRPPNSRVALFRPKVDELSFTVNTSSFSADSVDGHMVAFAGRKYAGMYPLLTFVANVIYAVLEFRKAGCKTCIRKGIVELHVEKSNCV